MEADKAANRVRSPMRGIHGSFARVSDQKQEQDTPHEFDQGRIHATFCLYAIVRLSLNLYPTPG
jgi:hypothetical protein